MKRLLSSFLALLCAYMAPAQPVTNFNTVPAPQVSTDAKGRTLRLADLSGIVADGNAAMQRNGAFLLEYVQAQTGLSLPVTQEHKGKQPAIRLQLDSKLEGDESYVLTVDRRGITISGRTPQGVFYGIQTLRKALPQAPADSIVVPFATVEATPRFPYRGMHLDVCRHFFGKDFVKRYIDMLALHGMNRLHWHLSDDQGWRIEIKKWPRLTEVGSQRRHTVIGRNMGFYDDTPYGGYFTQDDIREIVQYAAARYITIIPEIDMPGHMLAALTAYPELGCTGGPYEVWGDWGVSKDILCAGNPRVYDFLQDVVDEVMELFPSDIIHLGGDEAPKVRWQQCPKCQAKLSEFNTQASSFDVLQGYMVRHMEQYLAGHGRRLLGWDELMDCDVDSTAIIMSWRDWKGSVDPATRGFYTVKAPNSTCYFDHYQTPECDTWRKALLFGGYSPLEKVYAYDPAPDTLTPDEQRHVLGVQANLWTEYIAYEALAEYQVLPRMAALAEVQWLQPGEKDYDAFLERLPRLTAIYETCGWHYCKAALQAKH